MNPDFYSWSHRKPLCGRGTSRWRGLTIRSDRGAPTSRSRGVGTAQTLGNSEVKLHIVKTDIRQSERSRKQILDLAILALLAVWTAGFWSLLGLALYRASAALP